MNNRLFCKEAYDFELPEELIAQYPLVNRSESRLMVVNRENGTIEHRVFSDVLDYLNAGDVLVVNTTKVIPARLFGQKESGGKVEILLVNSEIGSRKSEVGCSEWVCLVKSNRKMNVGQKIFIGDELSAEIKSFSKDGTWIVEFKHESDIMSLLEKYGTVPLPPYISRDAEEGDKGAYQTVYAKHEGSVAAPTAGLHFTNELLDKIKEKGVLICEVILNVGLGTFRPVEVDDITEHKMHKEYCVVPKETADIVNQAKREGKKVVAVGTTSTRTLESFVNCCPPLHPSIGGELEYGAKWTDIFIYEGKRFNIVDAQITNFHTPKSTLLMMICAFGGYDLMMSAYLQAVENRYRFFSYGDAMMIN